MIIVMTSKLKLKVDEITAPICIYTFKMRVADNEVDNEVGFTREVDDNEASCGGHQPY